MFRLEKAITFELIVTVEKNGLLSTDELMTVHSVHSDKIMIQLESLRSLRVSILGILHKFESLKH